MRPSILDPLFADIRTLPRIGPKLAQLFARLHGREPPDHARLIDLFLQVPMGIIDRRNRRTIAEARAGEAVTLTVVVDRLRKAPPGNSRAPSRIDCHDATGSITLTFFRGQPNWLERAYPEGETVTIWGTPDLWNGALSMIHPEKLGDADADVELVEPYYPLTAGLTRSIVRHAVREAMSRLPELPEWQDPRELSRMAWPGFSEALRQLHHPETSASLDPESKLRRRLAYDEMLSGQLSLALTRKQMVRTRGRESPLRRDVASRLTAALPYMLTGAQKRTIAEIESDLARSQRMIRLLQGDVGSGKTVVALFAAAQVAAAGRQTALMAPTELLARQHLASIAPLAEAIGTKTALLTGKLKSSERRTTLEGIAYGSIDLVVGTHALFQNDVAFRDLGLVVVDEQHRFGVHQRLRLSEKGNHADLLVMTATPIPRTQVLAAYGDMDVSRLDEKPASRKPIQTVILARDRTDSLTERLGSKLATGERIYWVCPVIEDGETEELMSAESRFALLAASFGADRVGLIHGRMTVAEKDDTMQRFRSGSLQLLVATTVIEVGVDVPDATVIVIEHAERFGLAQLHQLRGRVGRGSTPSTCVLLYEGPLGETARARLEIMRQTEDGFRIAEEDLRLRGGGDVLGTRQAGDIVFRFADLTRHGDLLKRAHDEARLIIEQDPTLDGERGAALRTLLYVFSRDEAVRLLRAG